MSDIEPPKQTLNPPPLPSEPPTPFERLAVAQAVEAVAPQHHALFTPLTDSEMSAPAPVVKEHRYDIKFTGSAREYFGVWSINLALTLFTLGIYSAWAKVRKRRYLLGNTVLDGQRFDYRGNPWAILKGRAIAVVALLGYSLTNNLSLNGGHFVALFLALLAPFILSKSLAFAAHNTLWRNVRFGYRPNYWKAMQVIGLPLAALAGLGWFAYQQTGGDIETIKPATASLYSLVGLFYPMWIWARTRWVWNYARFGAAPFEFPTSVGEFYGTYVKSGFVLMGIVLVGGLCAGLLVFSAGLAKLYSEVLAGVLFGIAGVGLASLYMIYFGYLKARIGNLTLNNLRLGAGFENARIESTLKGRTLAWIYASNLIAIACSAGLLLPWAVIRTLRYRLSTLSVVTPMPIAQLTADVGADANALGEALVDSFGFDVGL